MRNHNRQHHVAIMGAGISGLLTGYLLLEKGYRVTIFEQEKEAGGMLASFQLGHDIYVDKVYRHIFPQNKELLSLAAQLGLTKEIVWRKNRTGIIKGTGPLPLDYFSNSSSNGFSWRDKYKLVMFLLGSLFKNDWRALDSKTAREMVQTRCGEKIWEQVFYPPLKAKFCGFTDEISAAWFYKKLRQRIKCRSFWGGEKLGAFKKGSKTLVERLVQRIQEKGGKVLTDTAVEAIDLKDDCFSGIRAGETRNSFDSLIVTTPTPRLIELFPAETPGIRASVEQLKRIDYVHSLCTLVRLKRRLSPYYWLFVGRPESPFFLVVEHTNLVDPKEYNGEHIVYLARYIENRNDLYAETDRTISVNDLNYLKMLFPHVHNEDIIDCKIVRTPFAQPVFKKKFFDLMPGEQGFIRGIHIINKAQLFPLERTLNDHLVLAKQCIQKWY